MRCPGGTSLQKAVERGVVTWLCGEAEGGVLSPSSSMVAVMQKPIEALPGGMRCPPLPQSSRSPPLHPENTSPNPVGSPRLGKGTEEASEGLEKRLT